MILRSHSKGPYVIFCDHASNHIPPELNNLGLPPAELQRHIAWDIGAAAVATELSRIFDSPAILCETSRLVIDCNRQLNVPGLIPEVSDGAVIPGNQGLNELPRQLRIERFFEPYHADVEAIITHRESLGLATISLSIHSMTPNLAGSPRPWQISLASFDDRTLVDPLLAALRRPGDVTVGDNQPYSLEPDVEYGTPYHAMRRKLPYIQVEFRQDEIAHEAGQLAWARRFAAALSLLEPPRQPPPMADLPGQLR